MPAAVDKGEPVTGVPGIKLIVGLPSTLHYKKRKILSRYQIKVSLPAKPQQPSNFYHRPATRNTSSVTVAPRITDSVASVESILNLIYESEQFHGRVLLGARALARCGDEWMIEDGRRARLVAHPNKHGHFRSFSNLFFLSGC